MSITSEEREQVVSELKRFAKDLNLTDQHKEDSGLLLWKPEKRSLNISRRIPTRPGADIVANVKKHRAEIRQRVENFL
jgi:hypothetical protein